MFPINHHDFYEGGCSCCNKGSRLFSAMEEETVHMPRVDVSFAPTRAFVGAFGEDEARRQGEKFVQPTWAQKMSVPLVNHVPLETSVKIGPTNPLLTREERVEVEAQQVPPAAFLAVGGIFLAGATVALLAAWRMGALSTATFMSP